MTSEPVSFPADIPGSTEGDPPTESEPGSANGACPHREGAAEPSAADTLLFEGQYAGQMDMAADWATVGDYLNRHRGWFTRCAHPMQVEPISDHGYALVVGRFSVLGYEVEPKVGLYLSPLDQRIYRIDTMAIPGYVPPGYDVDFKAVLHLLEAQVATTDRVADSLTQVDWELSLKVSIHKPRFLNALPQHLIKASGDRLLNQVVRQVSKRLTRRVQEDFHTNNHLPCPPAIIAIIFGRTGGRRGTVIRRWSGYHLAKGAARLLPAPS